MKKNRAAFEEFIELLKDRHPDVAIEQIRPFAGADYSVRVTVPSEDALEAVLDTLSELEYGASVNHSVSILSSVTTTGPVPASA